MLVSNDTIQQQKTTVSACFTEKIDNEIMWAHYANNAKGFALEYDYHKLREFGTLIEKGQYRFYSKLFIIYIIDYHFI